MSDWVTTATALSPTFLLDFTEGSGNLTDEIGGKTGTLTGSPTFGVSSGLAGLVGGVTIASGSYWSFTDHADLDLGDGPFTIEIWYKRGTDSDNGDILGKADGSAVDGYIVNQSSTDFLRLEIGSTSSHVFPNSSSLLNNTTIHHVVYTRASGTNAKCYVDGSDVTDVGASRTFSNNNVALLVGRGFASGSSYAGASLFGLAIYKSELTSGNVTSLYASRNDAPAAPSVPGYWDEVLDDTPTVLYKLDEASGNAADSSGNSHTATVNGSPVYQVAGPSAGIPYAVTFPSGAYFSCADHADFDLGNGPFTIEGFFKRPSTTSGSDLLGKADGSATSGYIVNMSATDYLRLEDGSTSSHVYPNSASLLDDTNWHHFAFTRASATNAKLYIDGVDVTDVGQAKTFTDNASALLIGRGYSTGSSFGGSLAGIALYKSELSSARIAAHYAARNDQGGTPPGPGPEQTITRLSTLDSLRSLAA